jgi:hypothetical protein
MGRSATTILVGLVLVAHAGAAYSKARRPPAQIPSAASDLIAKTAGWSAARDFASLRQVMTDNFIWSFGGEEGPDNAITEWRSDQRYLVALNQVLKLPCRLADYNGTPAVECPGKRGLSFRAWFVEAQGRWKFTAFVEGD